MQGKSASFSAVQDFVITRSFDAPRTLVWRAWTEREQLMQWFGPKGCSISHAELELRPGGHFHYAMRMPDGKEMWGKWTFREIIAPEKLVLVSSFSDARGAVAPAPMIANWPLQLLSTTTFAEHDGKTVLTLRWSPLQASALEMETFASMQDSMNQGWGGSFGQLDEYLEKDRASREIVITRSFDAPRELVWEAWTNPEHVVHWWGPDGFSTTIEKMEVRPGGVWKHVMHGPDGTDYPNSSVFTEVVKPQRIVYAHGGGRKGGPGAHFQATWTFEEIGNRTQLTIRMVFDTPADRDLVAREYGAIEGGKQTLARLDAYLAGMAA